MKITKKLRDVTYEELKEWYRINCDYHCDGCIFDNVYCCIMNSNHQWAHHKDLYSDKFLNQTIEVEVPDILDEKEKEYLSYVIKPFRHRILCIYKIKSVNKYCIAIRLIDNDVMYFPYYVNPNMYNGLELDRKYTLKELGL